MNLPQLTTTRFWAALCIVIYHLGRETWPFEAAPNLVSILHMAVGYFFTLSGFILVVAQARQGVLPKEVDAGTFWRNRFARIYPVYLVGLLLWLGFAFLKMRGDADLSPQAILFNLLLVQSWVPGYATSGNFPGWSLSVEMFFYAVFPFCFAVAQRFSVPVRFLLGFGVLVACLVATHVLANSHASHDVVSYLPLLHLGSFLMGVGGGYAFMHYRAAWLPYGWLWQILSVIALLASAWLLLRYEVYVPLAHNGALSPVYLLFIIGLSLSTSVRPVLARGLLPWLGEISYGMYILHIPLSLLAYKPASMLATVSSLPVFWWQLVILMGLSAASYAWLEVPARNWLRGKVKAKAVIAG